MLKKKKKRKVKEMLLEVSVIGQFSEIPTPPHPTFTPKPHQAPQ